MKLLHKKLKEFNTMLPLQLQVSSKEYLKVSCIYCELGTFFKLKTSGLSEYLFDLIPQNNHLYNTHFLEDVTTFYSRTDVFKYSFFPSTILQWNKLDWKMRQSLTLLTFRNSLLEILYLTFTKGKFPDILKIGKNFPIHKMNITMLMIQTCC